MFSNRSFVLIISLVSILWHCKYVFGHGMMLQPTSRSSLWRYDPSAPLNYNDNQLFCGGRSIQIQNGGKCGICGDNYNSPTPRSNELGGKYGQGKIVAVYEQGARINASIKITANHRGYFLFSLCSLDDFNGQEYEECFVNLQLTNDQPVYYLTSTSTGTYVVELQLPKDIKCKHCVLRWNYTTGNNWGICSNGTNTLGCGPQENFRNCADIAII